MRGVITVWLSRLMGERRITQDTLCRATGLARQTVNDLYHDRTTRIDFLTLDVLCRLKRCHSPACAGCTAQAEAHHRPLVVRR